jgi:serine protease 16
MVGASHNARLFALEHRFYGDSQPYDDWSLTSLEKLSSQQAMSDLAYFLGKMNEDNPDRETIVIGGSYPGALSAWFRSKYP